MTSLPRFPLSGNAVLATFAFFAAPAAAASDLDKIDFSTREGQVTAALAAAAYGAVPQSYNSLLFIERAQQSDFKFRNGQLGGGMTPITGSNFYIEGFIAAQQYQPEFVFSDSGKNFDRAIEWQSVMTTVGAGWQFDVAPNLTFRPTVDFSLGRITSNDDVPDPDSPGTQQDFIAGDGVTVGGYGGALSLDYMTRTETSEVDLRARYTALRLVPLGDNSDTDVHVDAQTLGFLARLRLPIRNWEMFGGPVRSVYEATYSAYIGEQGDLLDLPWLGRVGTGLEFETGSLARYAPPRTRLMLRYIFGEDFGAFGVSAGIVF